MGPAAEPLHNCVALPRLPLIHGNAVLLTDLLRREMYPPSAAVPASEFRLGLVTGDANVQHLFDIADRHVLLPLKLFRSLIDSGGRTYLVAWMRYSGEKRCASRVPKRPPRCAGSW